ncbi:Hsk1-interacting molecule 1 [Colletotrichum siamense]|nr:Hsk1-interacting molecule 1 [Colletotrichum siamense]KAI8164180.1 Hsk1-interacting molecule 1 [Colletotrichum sp. SAR 10_65]KAI8174778.1 Hsk1-interacting molecule 1 [Colletotrichum sp. SAR 10_75]KAI8200723.1 Hsk1-interacting molecule 1 [Colletotrichum sp. SAR 10_76]KAI8265225.1 Hsk1-interacting molecule 1 [Colletotrichum sp. SAR11_239]KAJ4996605.1 Hsk1-interacting molecule 1 [Colletotrichum sp. SAR 10_66]
MSTRRTPLSSNPNVANSPLRSASALALAKQRRSHANIQREELYGQPPPLKKQVVENTASRHQRSPSKIAKPSQLPQRVARPVTKERSTHHHDDANVDKIRQWQAEYRGRFPKMVFYFDSVAEDQRAKLSRHAMSLGARDERFFSSSITHVVTARPVPAQEEVHAPAHQDPEPEEQPQTINPSLLDRAPDARRRLLFDHPSRRTHTQPQDDGVRRARPTRSNDVLHKARDMGKKIWSVEKFQRMLQFLLEPDPHVVAQIGHKGESRSLSTKRTADEPGLMQLLQKERLNGPSDAVTSREMINFKGPYIYVYDIDEKQKPIMVREYPKVNNKYDGEWPQFRTVTDGRCPFVEEPEQAERPSRKPQPQQKELKEPKGDKERVTKPVDEERASLQPPEVPAPKTVIGKRTLAEMQDGQNKDKAPVKPVEMFNPPKVVASNPIDFRPQNAFTSRAGTARFFAGEPVASGLQPSNVTSAIRSQMISSTSGVNGAKAGTSKEVHGLQRKVLQRGAPVPHDPSSRRLTEMSLDATSTRSTSVSRTTSRRMELIEEDAEKQTAKLVRTSSKTQAPPAKSKRDLKPGYCENCQDKFKDFDEHILTRKHRKFAENTDNWLELDELLGQLGRMPKGYGDYKYRAEEVSIEDS